MYRNNKSYQQANKALEETGAEERQQIGEKNVVAGIGYDLLQNFAMNAPAMAAGSLTGLPMVGSAVIFASSFGNDLQYAEEGGHDAAAAYGYAFLDGLNQAALDYIGSIPGISQVGSALTKNIKNPLLKFLGDIAEEGFTEDMQSVVENGLKNIILGEMNDASPFSEEAMYSALLGALSAGLLNGPQVALEAKNTVKVGKDFLNSPGGITNLWVLGLSNPKSSEEYQTTVKLKEKMEKTGKMPSAYQVGALVLQCQSETAMTAREIDTAVRESAANTGVAAETAEAVAAVSTRFSKKVGFVPADAAILQTGNGAAAGAYDSETDTIFINASLETDTAVQFVLKHELTHSIEGTSMWNSLHRVIRREMGDAAFSAAVERVQNNRAAVGEQLDAAGAEKEVIANRVGDNLFKDGFADAVTKEDSKLGSLFAGTFIRLRYVMSAIKNGKQTARMQYAENLFRKALEKTPGTVGGLVDDEREVQFSLKEGAETEIDRVLEGENIRHDIQLTDDSPAIITEQKGTKNLPLVMKASHIRENILTVEEARQMGLKTGENIHYHGLGKDLFLKVIDGLNDITVAYRGTKNADMPNRRENYFLLVSKITDDKGAVINVPVYINQVGQYNNVVMGANRIATVYGNEEFYKSVQEQVRKGNLVRVKRKGIETSERLEDIPSGYSNDTSSDIRLSQDRSDVNSQYMQNSEKNTQRAVAGESETDIALRENTVQQENAVQQENTQESAVQEDTAQRTEIPERAGVNAYSNDYRTAVRQEDAVKAMFDEAERTASFDSEEELSPLEEVTQETQRRKVEKRTKFQEKQAAERADLTRRFKNGTLSEAEYDAALAKLTDEAVADNDKKWEKGARGRADLKEMLGEDYQLARDAYVKPQAEKILQEQRAKRQAAEEKRTRKAAEMDLEKKLNEAEARVLHPQKGRRIPARHAETMLKLLRTISVAVEDKQRYIADRREKLGDAVYPATQSRYENEIQKAMESGRALSKQFDEMLLLYKNLAKDDGLKSAYAPDLDADLSDFTERIRGKSISEMTTEDLTYGAALVGAVMHCEEYAQTFPAEVFGEECTVAEMMPQLLQELRENASELPRALKNFKTLWSDPIAVCNMLGGYHKDSKWVKLGK